MAYGTFSIPNIPNYTIANNYNMVNYKVDNTTYASISIFKTNPSTMAIAPAYYPTKSKVQYMADMNPEGVSPGKVIAKCTASPMNYGKDEITSQGLFYTLSGNVYFDIKGVSYSGVNSYPNTAVDYYPSFCVKKDGTATIRWFENSSAVATALPYCSVIFGA